MLRDAYEYIRIHTDAYESFESFYMLQRLLYRGRVNIYMYIYIYMFVFLCLRSVLDIHRRELGATETIAREKGRNIKGRDL